MFFVHTANRRKMRGEHGAGFGGRMMQGRGGGRGHEGRMGRGGGRRRLFDAASLRVVLLHLIEQEPRHGYDLIREIEEKSGGIYAPSPGVIYPTLTLLGEMGLIEEVAREGSRKQFTITVAGRANLVDNKDMVTATFERLAQLAAQTDRADHAPIMRALDNLQAVLRHRLSREGTDAGTILDAAALIDGAAQKIERL